MTEMQTMLTGPGLRFGGAVSFGRGITARVGEYLRFNAVGAFVRVEERPLNGLGFVYRVQPDGALARVFGL
jgi:hypothetical protein